MVLISYLVSHPFSHILLSTLLSSFFVPGFEFLTYFLVLCNHDITMGVMMDDELRAGQAGRALGRRNCTNKLIA